MSSDQISQLGFRCVMALTRRQKQTIFLALDGLAVALAMAVALVLVHPDANGFLSTYLVMPMAWATVLVGPAVTYWLGLPQIRLNSFDLSGVLRTFVFGGLTAGLAFVFHLAAPVGLPLNFFPVFGLLVLFGSVCWRIALLRTTHAIYRAGRPRERILVYGAGQTGRQLVAALQQDDKLTPIVFVDDNPRLQSQTISGLKVHAPSQIPSLVTTRQIDRIVLAMPSISRTRQAQITYGLRSLDCDVHVLPSFASFFAPPEETRQNSLTLEHLLGRNRLENALPGVNHTYTGRSILITGAGGSIGSELCRQLLRCRPECLVLLDHSEFALYQIDKELRDLSSDVRIVPVLGNVLDKDLVRQAMQENEVEVVLHAAAYKHVPMVERNALKGLQNNVLGTKVIADTARELGVELFILVSSDKAVRPTNVMGASKRLSELVVQDLASRSPETRFSIVRFGNVLGSSGSVIPLFEQQIAQGGPVTVTHEEVTRYFMTATEATRLVLLAGSFSQGGDVFVLDMGNPVPIRNLARQMIEGAGFSVRDKDMPNGDIEIRITGLRPGEKLHEELLLSPDLFTTPHPKILRGAEQFLSEFEVATALKDLRYAIETSDESAARAVVARWVERAAPTEKVVRLAL